MFKILFQVTPSNRRRRLHYKRRQAKVTQPIETHETVETTTEPEPQPSTTRDGDTDHDDASSSSSEESDVDTNDFDEQSYKENEEKL